MSHLLRVAASVSDRPVSEKTNRQASIGHFDLMVMALRIAGNHVSIIRKTPGKEEWCVESEKKNSDWSGGCYPSKGQAEGRLEEVDAAKHAKQSALPPGKSPPMGRYESNFNKKKPAPPTTNPYKSDDDARKDLKSVPIPKKPVMPAAPKKDLTRDRMDPEYEDADTFANFKYDNGDKTFDHEDLAHLNFRTRTPVGELKTELEGYGLDQEERGKEKKPRGFTDNPHDRWYGPGSEPMHGGAAYDQVMRTKYNINPFED